MPKTTSAFDRYTKADQPVKSRIIALSAGEPGSRKTSFWLEAPGPIVVHSMDRGLEGVVERYQGDKEIYYKEYDWNAVGLNASQEQARDIRAEFIENYEHSIRHARTVVLDKETDIWNLYRAAEGLVGGESQKDYAEVNSQMRYLVNLAKAGDVNLGIIESMKDKWGKVVNKKNGNIGQGPTGERVPAGFKEMDGLVHMVLMHSGLSPKTWSMRVGKVRGPGSMDLAETELPFDLGSGETLTFSTFAQLVFPESTPQEWE